ncbi:carbohydrate ABC transporter permease [Nonomuraea sp. NPDC059194]|uniref:carbohydrate ABC transporter permease n=1 Tax=Nonomuraea sp. NPDC059194 TaxID=3346764 RepID=UPI0036A1FC01
MSTTQLTTARTPGPAATARHEPSRWRRIRDNRWSYAYLLPFVVLTAVFTIYPIFASLGYTLYDWDGIGEPTSFVGLDNFRDVITDGFFWNAFKNSAVYTVVLVPVQLILALALALVLNNPKLRGSTFYRAVYFLPAVTSIAIVGIVLKLMLANFSDTLSAPLISLGLIDQPLQFLGDPDAVLWTVIAIGIWNTLGYNLIYFLAGLQTIPKDLYEAAQLDGAGRLAQLVHVTIPGLRNVGLVILFLAIIGSLQVFDLIMVLTGGGPFFASEVVNTYIYHQAFGQVGTGTVTEPNIGFASAASFFFGLVLLALTAGQMLAIKKMRARKEHK